MITCKECKFWYNEGGEGKHTYRENYYRDCLLDGDKFIYDPEAKDECKPDSLIYWDSDSFSASFQTGPDFGCIHGKKRD